MIMKKKYMILVVLTAYIASCSNDDNLLNNSQQPETGKVSYIRAEANENATTRGSVDGTDATFSWNTGDKIAVHTTTGYKVSDGLADTYNSTAAATFVFSGDNAIADENTRNNFAVYPASLVWDGSAIRTGSASDYTSASLKLTLPASYTLAEVQDDMAPTPMIAANAPDGDLSFKALCPLLRITVANIPKQTKRIEFNFNDKKVQGEFTLTNVEPGTTAIETTDTENADDIITVTMADNETWHDQLVVNLPVPAGSYGNITVTAYDAGSDGHVLLTLTVPIKSNGWAPTRKSSRKMTAILPVFSSSATQKIAFAPGNLIATICGDYRFFHFSFALEQYYFVGKSGIPGNYNSIYSKEWGRENEQFWGNKDQGEFKLGYSLDLIGWSNGEADMGVCTNTDDTYYKNKFFEWGQDYIRDGFGYDWPTYYEKNAWRTPSGGPEGEWKYLLETRLVTNPTFDGARWMLVTLNKFPCGPYITRDVKGLLIFPDNYTHPADVTIGWDYSEVDYQRTIGSLADWKKMEAAGAVFLPAAGFRERTSPVGYYEDDGFYWSKTSLYDEGDWSTQYTPTEGTSSYGLQFGSGLPPKIIDPSMDFPKHYGCCVRVIRDLN